jgi:hypothetical protein
MSRVMIIAAPAAIPPAVADLPSHATLSHSGRLLGSKTTAWDIDR